MEDPRAVEILPSIWSLGKPKSEWTYEITGFWDNKLKHQRNVTFTWNGAIEFCKKNGFIPCKRAR